MKIARNQLLCPIIKNTTLCPKARGNVPVSATFLRRCRSPASANDLGGQRSALFQTEHKILAQRLPAARTILLFPGRMCHTAPNRRLRVQMTMRSVDLSINTLPLLSRLIFPHRRQTNCVAGFVHAINEQFLGVDRNNTIVHTPCLPRTIASGRAGPASHRTKPATWVGDLLHHLRVT